MNITAIWLQSINGNISRGEDDDLSWGSKEDKNVFRELTKTADVMIMGRKTFESMPEVVFKTRKGIVLTRNTEYKVDNPNVEVWNSEVAELLIKLKERAATNIVVIGGGQIYSKFFNLGVVNNLWVTIAPVAFKTGTKALSGLELDVTMQLKSVEKLGENEVLLKYTI